MSQQQKAMAQMLLCAVMWSIAGLFIKHIPWNSFVLAGGRSLFAGLCVFLYIKAKKYRVHWSRRTVGGGILLALTLISFVAANKLTTAANAIVLQFTASAFLIIYSVVFYRMSVKKADLITVLFTLFGISLFFLDRLTAGNLFGNFVGIFAGASLGGMYLVIGTSDTEERFCAILYAHILCVLVGGVAALFAPPELSLPALVNVTVLGVVQLGIPYVLYGLASGRCSPLACSLIAVAEPMLNPLWVYLVDGEKPGAFALAGCVVVVGTVTLWCIYQERRRNQLNI